MTSPLLMHGGRDFHGEAGGLPLGKPLEQALSAPPLHSKDLDSAIGVDAVRPAAIGHVCLVLWELTQPTLQLVDRNRDRSGNVSRGVLVRRPRIEDDHLP